MPYAFFEMKRGLCLTERTGLSINYHSITAEQQCSPLTP